MRVIKFAVAIALVSSTSAFGAFFESEPNNTVATADPIVLPCVGADVGLAALAVGGGDVDYFRLTVPAGCILTAITTPMVALGNNPDTILRLSTDPGDVQILLNDDDGNTGGTTGMAQNGNNAGPNGLVNRGSAIRFLNNGVTNSYLLRVTGFGAAAGAYALTVSLVPEPSTLVLLGLGAVALIRRRK